jgi:ribonuclease BN (tRNA processing enzyme)
MVIKKSFGEHAMDRSLPRRSFLRATGISAAIISATSACASVTGMSTDPVVVVVVDKNEDPSRYRTRLVLLGVAGGPTLLTTDCVGVCTAVVYRDNVYLVDLGHGAQTRILEAGLGGTSEAPYALSKVRGIFFTHMHSDHLTEWPAVFATGIFNSDPGRKDKIAVFGPSARDTIPRIFPPGRTAPAMVNPENPFPGISDTTRYLENALSADINDRLFDSGTASPASLFDVRDIDTSEYGNINPEGIPPRISPFTVWTDGDVKVTALVDHRPTAPAFAFRFDTPDGSIVASGDTGPSENLVELAQGADYLVHEVIDSAHVNRIVETIPVEQREGVRQHLLTSHTTIEQVGRDVAERAGAKNLVLNHLVPSNNPDERWRQASNGFSGSLFVGKDLMKFGVGHPR